jgi:F-type H+-transporting ATPase subunit delta
LGVTEAAGKTADVLGEFDSLVVDVLDKMPNFEATLASPRVPHEDKVKMLDKAFGKTMSEQLLTFLKVVSKHGRLNCLRTINKSAHRLYDHMKGRVVVQVRTAEPLDAALLKSISEKLAQKLGQEVILQTQVDPDVIGGLVVKVGDTVFDGSVANQLTRFREEAIKQTSQQLRGALDRFVTAG